MGHYGPRRVTVYVHLCYTEHQHEAARPVFFAQTLNVGAGLQRRTGRFVSGMFRLDKTGIR